ncbi:chemotaxis protein CheA [Thioclava dalianensis]|uniref:Chemotaxis protein CheA n=1 Tax=Thioclava dalianensis TaxID=1185766 RepID=A0A074TM21_9RHOB|nr:chemotaxis protein CheA [Thioclava dalianensis]KEP70043.1 chemotaxis protein CheA [Thioclava dalianensis]SFN52787.1 two-component system, chemotaxis family, sensor kinase CheA [Thioclava dalianensis]
MSDPMAEIKASFFIECDELLESLQDALSDMDEGAHDSETINVVFRAVHSIKGGAGAFGLDALVAFAHRYETVMDEVRSGRLEITPEAIKHFFQTADLLADQVSAARDGAPEPEGSEACLRELESLMGDNAPVPGAEEDEIDDFQPMGLSLDLDFSDEAFGDLGSPDTTGAEWVLTFTPQTALYASGNDPVHLLRTVHGLDASVEITCDMSRLPDLAALDPRESYLSWQATLSGDLEEADLREVFDFVEDVAEITIATPEDATAPETETEPAETAMPDPIAPPEAPAQNVAEPPPAPTPQPQAETRPDAEPAKAAPTAEPGATVRVDLERIDRLVNLVGELVINQAMLAQSVAEAGLPPNSPVMTGLEAFMMLTRDIQDSVMMIRAQPVKPLFQRMARIVREASAAIEKEVRLRTEGETTEVDKTVIERLADPLTHMIRNAVDHGLEAPHIREAAGKSREGVITLSAQHRSGRVVIEVSDDGAGINREKVLAKAISKGLVAPEAQLSESEIDNLLFLPGFSTADQISALSGRGVGMDVVRSAIQALGGRISITSVAGEGTRFSISLPLTLAVLDGMVISVADETLVVPLSSIIETATLMGDDIRTLGPETNVIHVRGDFVPLYDLGAELGYRAPKANYEGGIVLLTAQENGERSALVVDAIMEQRQVVIKGLQQSYGHIPGVAAATILGDGQIALILDPADLVHNASGRTRGRDIALAG